MNRSLRKTNINWLGHHIHALSWQIQNKPEMFSATESLIRGYIDALFMNDLIEEETCRRLISLFLDALQQSDPEVWTLDYSTNAVGNIIPVQD